jgi:peptide/nickel transport system substrate-binding protein
LLLIAIVALACAGPSAPQRSAGSPDAQSATAPKRITVAIRGDAKTLSAKLNSSAGAGGVPGVSQIEEMLNAGLAIFDGRGRVHPQLAEEIPTVENGLWQVFPDGRMETTWRLRPLAVWHDGAPFTSEDLLFSARVEQDLPIFRNVAYAAIESVEAPDPQTIRISWRRPFIEADTMFTSGRSLPMPRHLLERPYAEDKESFLNLPYWNREFIGTGAFRLRELVIGSHLILDPNERYVLGRPKLDQVSVRFIPDPGTMAANILAGEIDLTLGGRLSIEWGVQIRDQWPGGRMATDISTSMISAYPQFINPSPPVVAEAAFRRALLHAVDRDQLIDSLVEGLGLVGHSIISPNHAEWRDVEPNVVRYGYDQRRAAELVESLGYVRGSDGFYRDGAGQRLAVEIRTQATDDQQMKTTFTLADAWKRIGVGAEPSPFPQQLASDREFRATRPAFEVVRQPGGWQNLQRFHGANTPLPENQFTGLNRTRYRNAQLDAEIDRFFSTIPRGERNRILGQLVHYMTDQVLILGMFWDTGPTMLSNRLRNVSDPGDVWDAHLWDVTG